MYQELTQTILYNHYNCNVYIVYLKGRVLQFKWLNLWLNSRAEHLSVRPLLFDFNDDRRVIKIGDLIIYRYTKEAFSPLSSQYSLCHCKLSFLLLEFLYLLLNF